MYRVYLDETGHGGRGPFADPAQPIYVLAGIWFSSPMLLEHTPRFLALKSRHNVQMDDVKGSKLVRSAPGRRFLSELLNGLGDDQVPVSVAIIHKAFTAAGVLVEDATDYVYNPRFPVSWTGPVQEKFDLMNWIAAHLPDALARRYWEDRSSESELAFQTTAMRCINALQLAPSANLRLLADVAAADWKAIGEMARNQNAHTFGGYSANLTAFSRFIEEADRLSELLGSPCSLIHDAQAEFSAAFKLVADIHMKAEKGPERSAVLRLPTEWIRSLEFESSDQSIGIQIADCVAAVVRSAAADDSSPIRKDVNNLMRRCHQHAPPYTFGPYDWMRTVVERLASAR